MEYKKTDIFKKLLGPLLFSAVVLAVFYYGGETYQAFGIAAFDSTRNVLKYVLGVIAFMALGLLVNRIVVLVIFNGLIRSATGFQVPKLLSQITTLLIFVITVAACANIIFNQDLTVLWAASGVAGLVLGMALKELLQDVFAGIALNIDQSVSIGDYVQIHKAGDEKVVGQLKEISWRSTHLETLNGELITFPNSKFSAFTITNFSASHISEKSVSVIIDGRVPALRAIRILQSAALDALTEITGQYEGLPHVGIKTIRNDGVEYQITYQVDFKSQNEASWKIQQAVILHLAKAGLKPAGHKTGDDPVADAGFLAPDETRLASLIKATAIFGNLSAEELAVLVRHTRLRTFQSDAIVVQAGEAGSDLYLVLEGLLNNGQVRKSNRDQQNVLRPGDLFHAAASLLGNVHKTTVRARTPSLICEIENSGLHELFSQNPDTMMKVARNLVEQDATLGIHWDEEKFEALLAQMRHLYPPSMTFSAG